MILLSGVTIMAMFVCH